LRYSMHWKETAYSRKFMVLSSLLDVDQTFNVVDFPFRVSIL